MTNEGAPLVLLYAQWVQKELTMVANHFFFFLNIILVPKLY